MIVTVYVGLKFIISLLMDHMQCRQLIVPEIIYAERKGCCLEYLTIFLFGKEKEKVKRKNIEGNL